MTWVKLDENAPDDPIFVRLPRGVRLLHLEVLAWSNRHAAGGFIPDAALSRLTDEPDPEAAAAALVDAGIWERGEGGHQLLWLLVDQPTPDEIAKARERNKRKQARHRRHIAGDHSTCDVRYCKSLRNPVSDPVSNGTPNRTEPNRPDRERFGTGDGNGDPAPMAPVALPSKEERIASARHTLETSSFPASRTAAEKQLRELGVEVAS